ncbi:MAG: DNRLRE domain-containing protein, partial [Cytophagales bacterium]|nr:DNRLRE domain-containing protein [Cytophagales bacterium]
RELKMNPMKITRNYLHAVLLACFVLILNACTKKECPTPTPTIDTIKTTVNQTKLNTIITVKNDTIKTVIHDTTYVYTTKYDTLRNNTRLLTLRQGQSNDGDVYIHEVLSTANGSSSHYMLICNWTRFGTPTSYRTLLKFDLTAIKSTETVLSAKLYLTSRTTGATDESTPDMVQTINNDIQICLAKGPWTATTVSWNTQPQFSTAPGEYLNFPGSDLSNTLHVFDLTPLVKKIAGAEQSYLNNGFVMKMRLEHDTYTSLSPYQYEAMAFHSMNSPVFQYLPYLEIQVSGP